mmetsp:Transcript_21610/g.37214  ORF Transcript_21610/g.37214 Transcript_21610/m.37214 type:complete len:116 (-) Transcript_21610:569-916(-)
MQQSLSAAKLKITLNETMIQPFQNTELHMETANFLAPPPKLGNGSAYILPLSSSRTIPTNDTLIVWVKGTRSMVLVNVSSSPKGIIDKMFPRAYSNAQHESGMRYCLAVYLRSKC